MIDILKCDCRLNFTFFLIFLLSIKINTKIQWYENNDFIKYLTNSKKNFKKNVKFDLQAHFNVSIMLNDFDRLFGL